MGGGWLVICVELARKLIDAAGGSSNSNPLRHTHLLLVKITDISVNQQDEDYNGTTAAVLLHPAYCTKSYGKGTLYPPSPRAASMESGPTSVLSYKLV